MSDDEILKKELNVIEENLEKLKKEENNWEGDFSEMLKEKEDIKKLIENNQKR